MKKLARGQNLFGEKLIHSFADCIVVEKLYLNVSACKQALSTDTYSDLV